MVKVYIYIVNGIIRVEDVDGNVFHRMTGFTDEDKTKMIIETLTNMYLVLDVYG